MTTLPEPNETLRHGLTELYIERLRPNPEGRYYVMDDGRNALRGFGVVVLPTGQRTFVARFRTRGTRKTSKVRRVRLGTFPEITVAEARERARHEIGVRDAGKDPAAARRAEKYAPAVRDALPLYMEHLRLAKKLKPRTLDEYQRQIDQFILKAIGDRKVSEVERRDIARLHGETLADRPYLANRVLALLAAFFSWSEGSEHRLRSADTNPCADIIPHEEDQRERQLSPAELGRLGDALLKALETGLPPAPHRKEAGRRRAAKLRAARGAPRGPYRTAERELEPANAFAVAAIRFLLLTGWRKQEALTLEWKAVNLETGRVKLKDTKTGQSYRQLNADALQVLKGLKQFVGCPFVFPGTGARAPIADIKHVWESVRIEAKLDDVRLHDLRHSFASSAASAGESLLVISKLLGHKDLASTQRYAHLADSAVQRAADDTGAGIAAQIDKRETPVTPIRKVGHSK